ncbi:MAG: CHASE3 domain sensor protein [Moritella dasanensis]|jgi:CHASE3 domain sensor protein
MLQRMNNLSIRNKIFLCASIPILLLINISIVVYINIERTISTAKWVEHTHAVTAKGHELVKLMLDMETGERGYLITGKSVFLEPYYSAKDIWNAHLEALKIQVSDNPSQVAKIEKIGGLQKRWINEAAEIEIAARNRVDNAGSLNVVIKLIESQTGKQIIDNIRAITATQRIRSGDAGESNHQIPVIALTASVMVGDKEKCFNVGMSDYLSKPINVEELEAILLKWLKPEKCDDARIAGTISHNTRNQYL